MERQVKKLYKKIGGGIHRFEHKNYKTGDQFYAYPSQISETQKAFIIEIAESEKTKETPIARKKTPVIPVEPIVEEGENNETAYMEGKGAWFRVFEKDGTPAHEGSLRKKDAQELLEALLS